MEIIKFAKKFIDYVFEGKDSGIEFAECELEKQGLGEQKDQIIDYVYELHKQGKTKEEVFEIIIA